MKAVSEQDLDSAVALEAAARADVRASEASVDLAEIDLSYTRILAPIDGLIGISKARPGEFVGREPNPVVLNFVSRTNPIRVRRARGTDRRSEYRVGAAGRRHHRGPVGHPGLTGNGFQSQ